MHEPLSFLAQVKYHFKRKSILGETLFRFIHISCDLIYRIFRIYFFGEDSQFLEGLNEKDQCSNARLILFSRLRYWSNITLTSDQCPVSR